ncbi:GELS1-like protein [Mya arenaria]|uniref:GELS1-like protein n=1 Tax=Mya arenaria TaxID=6604 RepID=A0ABY7G7A5_MYAAR|nr:GELS1-like protein [Mya arenaria]
MAQSAAETEPAWRIAGRKPGLQIWRIVTYKDQGSDILKYDVHFWIGKYSTQTVELDTYLDDRPIQHREVQGHESKLFKSYFKTIELLRGGADSGFRHVEAEAYQSRLLHFHGDKRHVEIAEGVFYGKLDENVDDIVDSEEENQNITKSDTIKKLFRTCLFWTRAKMSLFGSATGPQKMSGGTPWSMHTIT